MIKYDNKDWLWIIRRFHGSVCTRIWGRILLFVIITTIFCLLHALNVFAPNVSTTPHSIVGVALGLMLVFRTNTAYDRYWEGRRAWGGAVSRSRDLLRRFHSYTAHVGKEALVAKRHLVYLICAYVNLTMMHLRDAIELESVSRFLSEKELAELDKLKEQQRHLPLQLLQWINDHLHRCYRKDFYSIHENIAMEEDLTVFVEHVTACERILKTPIPFAYAQHLKQLLYIFIVTMPLPLVVSMGWWTTMIVALVAYALLGIEEIGVEIEDPFGDDPNDLPVEDLCATIEKNLSPYCSISTTKHESSSTTKHESS